MTKPKRKLPPKPSPKAIEFYSQVDTPPVYIDDRAGSVELVNIPPLSLCGELMRLDSGDACFTGNGPDGPLLVGVELKSVTELISSMETGRLQGTQLPAMLEHYGVVWLLHYGDYQPSHESGDLEIASHGNRYRQHCVGKRPVPYGYLEGFLFTCTAIGVHVKRVADVREAAVWIGALARWWAKPWSKHTSMHKFDRSNVRGMSPSMDEATKAKALTALAWPGLGYERAMAAARHFASIDEMVNATREQWAEVPGVGKVLATSVTETIKRKSTNG